MSAGIATEAETLEQLLASCAGRDAQAFERLYKTVSPQLYGVVLRILKSRARAQDALQDAFIQIWERAGDYRPDRAKPLTWLISIARYRALDILRRDGRSLEATDIPTLLPTELEQPMHSALRKADEQTLMRCMDELSQDQRLAIWLAYLEGLTRDEIAVHVKSTVNTVKSWIRRGLSALRACIGK